MASRPPPLRRDDALLPLLSNDGEVLRVGERAIIVLGEVDDYPDYVATVRTTTPVISIGRLMNQDPERSVPSCSAILATT